MADNSDKSIAFATGMVVLDAALPLDRPYQQVKLLSRDRSS
jgi:hypothetical protein